MATLATILVALAAAACFIKPVWGFLGFIAIVLVRPNEIFGEGEVLVPSLPLMIMATGLGLIILLLTQRTLPRPPGPPSRAAPLMIAMVVMIALQLLLRRPADLTYWLLNEGVQVLLILLYMTRLMAEPGRLAGVFTTVTVSNVVVTGIPFFVHFFFKGKEQMVRNPAGGRDLSFGRLWDLYHLYGYDKSARLMGKAKTMWGNSNDLGMLANWAVAGVLYQLRRKGSKLLKLVWIGILAMLEVVVFLTRSRNGLLQSAIIWWMVFIAGKRRILGIVLMVIAMGGIVFVLPMLKRGDAEASEQERKALLMVGVGMFKSNPLIGVGYNTFQEHSFKKLLAHNVYMQCLTELGLVGAAVFFPMIFFLRRETAQAVRFFESRPDPNRAMLARAIGALQFSYTIFIFFSNQFMRFTFAIPMSLGIALYLAMQRERALIEAEEREAAARAAENERLAAEEAPDERWGRAPLHLPAHEFEDELEDDQPRRSRPLLLPPGDPDRRRRK